MTSGVFRSFPVASITIPAERQRSEISNIEELADSIQRVGLINPPVITREGVLIAGQRRFTAVKSLGWTDIPVQFAEDLSREELHVIELEENVKRVDLPWQDHVRAVQEYHQIRLSQNPSWTQADTAKALGISDAMISRFLLVAREIENDHKSIAEAPKFSTAFGIAARKASREADSNLAQLKRDVGSPIIDTPVFDDAILNVDFRVWAPEYSGPKFNLLHCDFPYGIGAGNFDQSGASAFGGYEDSRDTYFSLLNTLAENLDNICAESAHIVFWLSMKYYQETLDFFESKTDFHMQYIPLVWVKHLGIISDPQRVFRNNTEFALFGSRGDRKIVRTTGNAYNGASPNREHMSEKYEPMLKHFFNALVDHTTIFLDPTCGSGSSLRAAESCGAAFVRGLEINPEYAANANLSLNKSRALRKLSEAAE